MKAVITGANGQLGRELQRSAPAHIECIALARSSLDIGVQSAVDEQINALAPQLVINAAAYTAVDVAEADPDRALQINGMGAEYLARACQRTGARLLHVSTDFVFDGSAEQPYLPQHEPRPLGAYGHSKLAGERRVQEILPLQSVVLRTAWLYSCHGDNFVNTMLALMAARDTVRVVADQMGAPTWAQGLAQVLWRLLDYPAAHGYYHWTDTGCCSWYQFACAIYAEALALGLLEQAVLVEPIGTADYPTPAQRPAYSVLDCNSTSRLLGLAGQPWRQQLRAMLGELKALRES